MMEEITKKAQQNQEEKIVAKQKVKKVGVKPNQTEQRKNKSQSRNPMWSKLAMGSIQSTSVNK